PAANQYGTATITVTVSDGSLTASDTFVLTVNPVNDPPTISDIPDQVTSEDTPIGPIAFTVGDIDNDPSALTVAGASSNAVLVPSANIVFGGSGTSRTVTITPAPNRSGVTVITVTVRDPGGLTASDTFVLTVNPVNDPPVANGQNVATAEDTPVAITLSASDVDGDPLTYIVVGGPSHGTLSGAAPNLVYTPDPNWFGSDSFTFKVNDGNADSNVATVNITVTEVNDPPTATASASPTDGIAPLPVFFTGDGSDVDGDPLVFSWDFGDGTSGTGKNPMHIYTAGGTYVATLTVSDGRGGVATATVTITVANADAMNITKLKILREFEGKKRLLIRVEGNIVVPERVPAEGTVVRLDVGGVVVSGTMDGKGRISTEEFRFRFKPAWLKLVENGKPKWVTAYGPAKFKATIGGDADEWGDEFEDEGLTKGAGLTSPMVRVWLRIGGLSYGGLYKGEWKSTESRGVFR
ncbi:MAG: Ig-like domain-containing protein, partial [Planctomycetota bacterium]|nr:Ig-like domain-containing protein [Planctomycetota bacterium]